MPFRIAHNRANFFDVQETHVSFAQQHRSRDYFVVRTMKNGRLTWFLKVLAPAEIAAVGDCSFLSYMFQRRHSLFDSVPPNITKSLCRAPLYISEDSVAVIRMIL